MVEKIVSPANSLKGWKFSEWFVGNWKTVKEIIKVGAPLLVTSLATQNPYLLILFTAIGKLILDTGEYYFSVYKK